MIDQIKDSKNVFIQIGGSIIVGKDFNIGDREIVLPMDTKQSEEVSGLRIRYQEAKDHLQRNETDQAIEKKILNSTQDFLEIKGIDTAEFRERKTKILNEGIIITGGSINAQNIDIGKKETFIGKTIKNLIKTSND